MDEIRKICKIVSGKNTVDGAGVKLVRFFGKEDVKEFDPFLLLDGFDSINSDDYIKGFPWHPHRGIETVTYLIKGQIEHGDSLGNRGTIWCGDCQWMTAGSGIVHKEMPKETGRLLGVQLWINLPKKDKMTNPKYRDIISNTIPIIKEDNVNIKIISGYYKGNEGAIQGDYVKTLYLDVGICGEGQWEIETNEDSTLFAYILEGEGNFNPIDEKIIGGKNVILFDKGKKFWVKSLNKGIRFLLILGKSLKEDIAWGGPIVMNSREELNLAFKELDEDEFIKE